MIFLNGKDECYDFDEDIQNHCNKVNSKLQILINQLCHRGKTHDSSKFKDPEYKSYKKYTPLLHNLQYQSKEYKQVTHNPEFRDAINHHKSVNSHHPEFYENGVNGMDLVDVIEMLCDWKSADERYDNSDWSNSFKLNCEKYGIDNQLASILLNTYERYLKN